MRCSEQQLAKKPLSNLPIAGGCSCYHFSVAGFTLPISSLPVALQGMSWLYPLRFYYKIYVQEAIFGMGFSGWWISAVALLVFLLIPLLGIKRLEGAYINQNYPRN